MDILFVWILHQTFSFRYRFVWLDCRVSDQNMSYALSNDSIIALIWQRRIANMDGYSLYVRMCVMPKFCNV